MGQLEVADDHDVRIALPRAQARLLALLALSPNQVVSAERLAEDLWEGAPPPTAVTSLRAHVSRLRKALGDESRLQTKGLGYLLRVDPGESDLEAFANGVARARVLTDKGEASEAAAEFARALALWRGPALSELADAPWARVELTRLEEARLTATEEWVEAELAAGHHSDMVSELDALCLSHPLRERLWAARMLALYRCGRQADALRAYQALRSHLAEELGIDPSPDLSRLEAAVLAQDPSLELPVGPPAAPVPAEADGLPTGVVTFLLTDVVASTEAWEAEPAAMARALARHDAVARDIVTAAGGVLLKAKGEGDATLSVFRRASAGVAAAVALQRALREEPWPTRQDLQVRMALHSGEAYEREGDYFGPTVNRGARIRSIAGGGQVVLSGATAELVFDRLPDGYTLVELGHRTLRGVRRPERLFALAGPGVAPVLVTSSETSSVADALSALPLPGALAQADRALLVGRDAERRRLADLWVAARHGTTRLVLIGGEPGIGKSRLAADVAGTAYGEGALVLHGRCEEDVSLAYQPFVEAIGSYVAALPDESLFDHVAKFGPDLLRLLPDLARRLPGDTELDRAEPETERYMMFESVRHLLESAATLQPIVLVVDDLHWATHGTTLLLRHLVRQGGSGVLVVGTFRDTEIGPDHPLSRLRRALRDHGGVELIVLHGLDEPAVAQLVDVSWERARGPARPDLARALLRETAGNPLFLGELLRDGAESAESPATWLAPGSRPAPVGVRAVVTQRLARLSDPTRRVLAAASVLGDGFTVADVAPVLETLELDDVIDAVEEGLRARLLVERGNHYAFWHGLVRNAVYGEMSAGRRTRLHQQVAEHLERRGVPDRLVPTVAHHFLQSVPVVGAGRAVDWLVRAGRLQHSQLAFELAAESFRQALALVEHAGPEDALLRADLLLALARAQFAQGDVAGFKEAAMRSADEARSADATSRLADAAVLRAWTGPTGAPEPDTVALCEEALVAVGAGDPVRRAQLLSALAFVRAVQDGDGPGAEPLVDEAVALVRDEGPPEVLARALYVQSLAIAGFAPLARRVAVADELLSVAANTTDLVNRGYGLLVRIPLHLAVGEVSEYERRLAELSELAEATRDWYLLAATAQHRAARALLLGDFAAAAELAAQMLSYSSEQDFVSVFTSLSFFTHWAQGRLEQVLPLLEAGFADTPTIPYQSGLALALAELGRHDEAAAHLAAMGADGFASVPRNSVWPATMAVLSDVAWTLGDAATAEVLLGLLEDRAGELIVVAAHGAGYYAASDRILGVLAATTGDGSRAVAHFDTALALEQQVGAKPLECRTRFCYGKVLAASGTGRAMEMLTACVGLADELGMAKVAADARAILG